jgi:hypothetical protein
VDIHCAVAEPDRATVGVQSKAVCLHSRWAVEGKPASATQPLVCLCGLLKKHFGEGVFDLRPILPPHQWEGNDEGLPLFGARGRIPELIQQRGKSLLQRRNIAREQEPRRLTALAMNERLEVSRPRGHDTREILERGGWLHICRTAVLVANLSPSLGGLCWQAKRRNAALHDASSILSAAGGSASHVPATYNRRVK